jgi:hypothetical protein
VTEEPLDLSAVVQLRVQKMRKGKEEGGSGEVEERPDGGNLVDDDPNR